MITIKRGDRMIKMCSLRIKESDYKKIKIIAENNDRSVNKQIERLIKNAIADYEKINGEIPIEDI